MLSLRKLWPVLTLVLLTIPVIFPLLQPGFFATDDGNWMVIRLAAFHQTLRSGQFPVRFLYPLNHGFGYPVADFLYPLPFYLGEIIHLAGFGFVDSVKIIFLLSFLCGAIFMYFLVRPRWGNLAALAASLLYTYAPYHIFDTYHRGSLGEVLALALVPLVFYFLQRQSFFAAALSFAALITAHNVIALIFSPFILLFAFKPKQFKSALIFLLLSLATSAFFWLPALYDLQFTRAAATQVADFRQYFLDRNNFLSLVGPAIPFAIITSVLFIRKTKNYLVAISLLAVLVSLFFTSGFSGTFWQFPLLPKVVQFPWRFLSVTVFGSSILLAVVISRLNRIIAILVIFVSVALSIPLINVVRTNFPDSYYSTNDDTTTVKNEYMSKWVVSDPKTRPVSYIENISPNIIRVNQIYFPGWEVFVDGKKTPISYADNGLIEIAVTPGSHNIKAEFTETPLRTAADIVSLLSLGVTALWATRPLWKGKGNSAKAAEPKK
ncbi:6-pyruvoyl-tetrahydropterin synthase-related protein [Patescibacteria group bacterium]|nr:6-pyruvoyl-tetrahydropterin synthase-related protein [Patescibacteria group bacterium]